MSTVLAEGKTKILREGAHPDELYVEFKNDATAFNGKKHAEIPGKGELNAKISIILFDILHQAGISTCYVSPGQASNTLVYKRLSMIPLEVVIRNYAYGSIVKRFGFEEGMPFRKPLLEFFLKTDEDPQITDELIEELRLIPDSTCLDEIKRLAYEINELFVQYFTPRGIRCADFKIEFGVDEAGRLTLGDELSPDNFRLRDAQTGAILDKDVFRLDLADLGDTYRELLHRLENAPPKPTPETTQTYQVEVRVQSRKNILNPESRTVLDALHTMGYSNVTELQAGKRFTFELTAPTMVDAESKVKAMSESLLSNPVIEDYAYSLKLKV